MNRNQSPIIQEAQAAAVKNMVAAQKAEHERLKSIQNRTVAAHESIAVSLNFIAAWCAVNGNQPPVLSAPRDTDPEHPSE